VSSEITSDQGIGPIRSAAVAELCRVLVDAADAASKLITSSSVTSEKSAKNSPTAPNAGGA
jgi:hypothetical protein